MSDPDAILARCAEKPTDAAGWLVLSDALQEAGDPAWMLAKSVGKLATCIPIRDNHVGHVRDYDQEFYPDWLLTAFRQDFDVNENGLDGILMLFSHFRVLFWDGEVPESFLLAHRMGL